LTHVEVYNISLPGIKLTDTASVQLCLC